MKLYVKVILLLSILFSAMYTLACDSEPRLIFRESNYEIEVDESFELNPIIVGTNGLVKYSFDKEGILDQDGNLFIGIAEGEVVITAILEDVEDITFTINVHVKEHVHVYDEIIINEDYKHSEATCISRASYYYSCVCGDFDKDLSDIFYVGKFAAHIYDKRIVDNKYLKSKATCISPNVYYKVCACGAFGDDSATFEYGELGDHVYDREITGGIYLKANPTCTHSTIYYKSCICGEFDENLSEEFYRGICLPHVYDQEVADEKYLKNDWTCNSSKVYYKSCDCGKFDEKSSETFTYGGYKPHIYDQEVVDTKYLYEKATCTQKDLYYTSCVCGEYDVEQSTIFEGGSYAYHVYNKLKVDEKYMQYEATCTRRATYYKSCECGHFIKRKENVFSAGAFADHQYSKEVVDSKYLASEATADLPAQYYKSCYCGAKGTETFYHVLGFIVVTGIELKIDKTELTVGEEIGFIVEIIPVYATNADYNITSSDENVIKIDNVNNKIIAVGIGTCTIIVTSLDVNQNFVSVNVTVKENSTQNNYVD